MDKVTIRDLYDKLDQMEEKIEKKYVSKIEFLPVRLIVYGAVALTLTKVASSGLAYVVSNFHVISIVLATK